MKKRHYGLRVYRVQCKQGVYHLWFGNEMLAFVLPKDDSLRGNTYQLPVVPLQHPIYLRKIVAQNNEAAIEKFSDNYRGLCLTGSQVWEWYGNYGIRRY